MAKKLQITLKRSLSGERPDNGIRQKRWDCGKSIRWSTSADTPAIRGMIDKVNIWWKSKRSKTDNQSRSRRCET